MARSPAAPVRGVTCLDRGGSLSCLRQVVEGGGRGELAVDERPLILPRQEQQRARPGEGPSQPVTITNNRHVGCGYQQWLT